MLASLPSGDLLIVAAIVGFAALAQMVSGFGFALLAVPVMGLAIDVKTAVVISAVCGTASNTFQAVVDRRHADHSIARRLIVAAFFGMPIGLVVLESLSVETLKILVGFLVIVAVVGVANPRFELPAEPWVERLAGFVSGLLATSTSTNGPPLVLLLRARRLTPDRFRATINTVFSVVSFVSIAIFAVGGRFDGDSLTGSAVAVPGLIVGMTIGRVLRGRIDERTFWRIVLILLVGSAFASIASGLV